MPSGKISAVRSARRVIAALAVGLTLPGCMGGEDAEPAATNLGTPQKREPVEIGNNVVRMPGLSAEDIAAASALAAYDPKRAKKPAGFVLVRSDDWHSAVLAAQFTAAPVNAALLAVKKDYIPPAPADVLNRVKPTGFPKAKGLKAVVIGSLGSDVYLDLQDAQLKLTNLRKPPAELAAQLVPFRGGWAKKYSDSIMVVSSEARSYGVIAAAWSAYSGDTITFVGKRSVPKATETVLAQRKGLRLRQPTIYVVGPKSVIPDSIIARIRRYGPVKRIAGRDAVETAVAFARYHDRSTGFGFGLRKGPASVSLVDPAQWAPAIGAFTFAATGPRAPVLLAPGRTGLPPAVVRYLSGLRGKRPNQAYVFGNKKAIDSATVAALDRLLAAERPTRGR